MLGVQGLFGLALLGMSVGPGALAVVCARRGALTPFRPPPERTKRLVYPVLLLLVLLIAAGCSVTGKPNQLANSGGGPCDEEKILKDFLAAAETDERMAVPDCQFDEESGPVLVGIALLNGDTARLKKLLAGGASTLHSLGVLNRERDDPPNIRESLRLVAEAGIDPCLHTGRFTAYEWVSARNKGTMAALFREFGLDCSGGNGGSSTTMGER